MKKKCNHVFKWNTSISFKRAGRLYVPTVRNFAGFILIKKTPQKLTVVRCLCCTRAAGAVLADLCSWDLASTARPVLGPLAPAVVSTKPTPCSQDGNRWFQRKGAAQHSHMEAGSKPCFLERSWDVGVAQRALRAVGVRSSGGCCLLYVSVPGNW